MTAPMHSSGGLHGVVYVADLERCAAFYTEVCGLTVVAGDPGDFVTLASDAGVELSLVLMPAEFAMPIPPAGPERRSDAAVKLSFPVTDLARARELAPTLGGLVDDVSTQWTFRGSVHCHGTDPEGNVVSFRQPSTTG